MDGGDEVRLDGLYIGPRESIIFVVVQSSLVTNAQQFREWWGLPDDSTLQIVFYSGPGNGFAPSGDEIRLWGPGAQNVDDVVDRVEFGDARPGHTFTYDPFSGLFGQISQEGVGGAFKALTRDDVGSPGFTTGPVPLSITSHPTSLHVCAGVDATFSVTAVGLPRAHYQWFHEGQPILGATAAKLTVFNPQSTDEGQYEVMVSNITGSWRSQPAFLTVNATESAPVIIKRFADVSILVGETARFIAPVCANPTPSFTWSTNGTVILGIDNRTLTLPNCDLSLSNTLICVQVTNSRGSTSLCARLMVAPKPKVFFTEVMGSTTLDCPNVAQEDWFELTNFDTKPVNLLGYRFASGNGFDATFDGARTITVPVNLQPGQSAVFVRNIDGDRFRRWWGAEALPPDLPIIPFFGLGIRSAGDELYLWSPDTEDPTDWIATADFAGFSAGVSKRFECREDPNAKVCFAGEDLVAGEHGAFLSVCGDVGSPGFTTNPPPRLVWLERGALGVTLLRWRAIPGRTYVLEANQLLRTNSWSFLGNYQATNFAVTAFDPGASSSPHRFYRVIELK
jgi:hypothetical protein